MSDVLYCYRCGASLAALSLPLGRLDECPDCRVELHVCRMCIYFDPAVSKQCREDDAEEVKEKTRANFCDWFKPNPAAHDPRFKQAETRARDQLGALFGETDDEQDDDDGAANPAEDLFR